MTSSITVRAFVAIAALAFVSAACSTSNPYREPFAAQPITIGDGEQLELDRVIVLVDASGSVDPKSVFPSEKAWIESFVQGMPDSSYDATIRSFGGDRRRGVPLSAFDREQMAETARGLKTIGEDTPLDVVLLELADQLAGAGGRTAVIVVSDGIPNPPQWGGPAEPTLDAGRAVIAKAGGEVCFHTVLAGEDAGGRVLLESLSGLTSCGSFRDSGSITDSTTLAAFERDVFVTDVPLPAVAARGPSDIDRDGVIDSADSCPTTPLGAQVDARGCWILKGVQFATNSAEIAPGSEPAIDAVANVLKQNPDLRIQIAGFTDDKGAAAYNQQLSQRRADSVAAALTARGVDATRLDPEGFGEQDPIADNGTPAGRAENRRIEFAVLE